MDQKQLVKQILDFNKTTLDNSFNAMVLLQEQSEKLGKSTLDQATWLPEEGKKVIDDFTEAFKKGRDEFKKSVDDAFSNARELFLQGCDQFAHRFALGLDDLPAVGERAHQRRNPDFGHAQSSPGTSSAASASLAHMASRRLAGEIGSLSMRTPVAW